MDKKSPGVQEADNLPFEKALEKLEMIVEKMESGKLSLEEMMRYFEDGSRLSSLCENKLKELEKKIEVLVSGESPEQKWKEFNPDAVEGRELAQPAARKKAENRKNDEKKEIKPDDDVGLPF